MKEIKDKRNSIKSIKLCKVKYCFNAIVCFVDVCYALPVTWHGLI